MRVSITAMALVHPPHPIKSRSRNKRRNLWVGRWVSSSLRWFWPVYSTYYIHAIHYSCNEELNQSINQSIQQNFITIYFPRYSHISVVASILTSATLSLTRSILFSLYVLYIITLSSWQNTDLFIWVSILFYILMWFRLESFTNPPKYICFNK